ncbi:AAA family ATPase [Terasakiella pusilla]|uniref:AAA family ATPase n=1 Tax=Terasakiella pusilla TaxID=64973 RepID=UPI003AA7E79C
MCVIKTKNEKETFNLKAAIEKLVAKIWPNFQKGEAFKTLSLEDIEKRPPPEWLFEGLLHKNTLNLFYGASGLGKSFLAIALMCSAAQNKPCGDVTVDAPNGWVLYISLEGHNGLSVRFKAFRKQQGIEKIDNLLVQIDGANLLDDSEDGDLQKLSKTIHDLSINFDCLPSLIIVDTFALAIGSGDENNSDLIADFVKKLEKVRRIFETTFIVIHHTGHNGTHPRGSSAFIANFKTVLRLGKDQNGDVYVKHTKIKEGEKRRFWVEFSDVSWIDPGYGEQSSRVAALRHDKPKSYDKKLLELLIREGREGGIRQSELQKLALVELQISKSVFYRVCDTLIENGQMKRENRVCFST